MQVYGTSKIYLIMASKALNEKLKGSGVEVFAAHPGEFVVRTLLGASQKLPLAATFLISSWHLMIREATQDVCLFISCMECS